ncbi:MAG: hypothetical protein RIS29_2793 [Bacteroidota bacterium]|jgi:hypothetical protein
MKRTIIVEFFYSNWKLLSFVVIVVFIFAKGCIEENYIDEHGVLVNVVTVGYENHIKGKSTFYEAFGYYRVNNIDYKCYNENNIPVGSIFRVKYNPKNPSHWRNAEE